jgi:hypothetical protein
VCPMAAPNKLIKGHRRGEYLDLSPSLLVLLLSLLPIFGLILQAVRVLTFQTHPSLRVQHLIHMCTIPFLTFFLFLFLMMAAIWLTLF